MASRFSERTHFLRAALSVSIALVGYALPAVAQDATWNLNGTGDYDTAANWTPSTLPTGTAFFGVSNQNAVTFSAPSTLGGWTFNVGASAYIFANDQHLLFNGAGIVINGGSATIANTIGGVLQFHGSSTSGAATIDNSSLLSFFDASTAANTIITNSVAGSINFSGTSTAGSASATNAGSFSFNDNSNAGNAAITNNGNMNFDDSSTGGNAIITNTNNLIFRDSSTASSAAITNSAGGRLLFAGSSTAGTATISNSGSSSLLTFGNTSTGGSATISNSGFLIFADASTAGNAVMTNSAAGLLNFANFARAGNANITNNGDFEFNGFSGASTATIINNADGTLEFSNNSTADRANITNAGTLDFVQNTTAGSAIITNSNFMSFNDGSTAGSATITNSGILNFFDSSTASNATITNSLFLSFFGDSAAGTASVTNSGTLLFDGRSTAENATINNSGSINFIVNSTGGNAAITNTAGATVNFAGSTGPLGDRRLSVGSIAGAGQFQLGLNELTVGGNNLSTDVPGVISGIGGSLVKVGTGMLTLSGDNTYLGPTTVNAGILDVNGSIASSILTTVNAGATLAGNGIVGNTEINGGTLAPGNSIGTLTVNGNLSMTAASTYQVELSPSNADRTNVTGTATLGGTVQALFQPGSYVVRTYTILSAAGGLGRSQFSTLVPTDLPTGFEASLTYTPTDVLLGLTAAVGEDTVGGPPLNQNQRNVAKAINDAFNNGASLPAGFLPLFDLSGPALRTALTQLSGEPATGMKPAANLSMSLFLNAMLDPFVTGRGGSFGAAIGYAPEASSYAPAREAFAASFPVKALPPRVATFGSRWGVWGSAYGGRNRADGDAALGSQYLPATAGGFAAGLDYRVSPGLTLGAALAIGEAKWTTSGLGNGDSNLAQIGGYASAQWGAFYASAAIAGAWHDVDTTRTVTVNGIDRLDAGYNATAFGARLESGWRNNWATFGVTPYAALQVQSVHTPAYSESASIGTGTFALTYGAQTSTDTRTELGLWVDHQYALADGAFVVLRGRAAWVHDFNPENNVNALFQTLPAANFTVNGAATSSDSALTSLVGELRLANGLSLIAKFDGEFSGRSQTYAGHWHTAVYVVEESVSRIQYLSAENSRRPIPFASQ